MFLPSGVHTKPKPKTRTLTLNLAVVVVLLWLFVFFLELGLRLHLILGLGLLFGLVSGFVLMVYSAGQNIVGSFFWSYALLFSALPDIIT